MASSDSLQPHPAPWRAKIFTVIFGTHTFLGRAFDVALLVAILTSIVAVSLETVESLATYADELNTIEWLFTIMFTVEYALRMSCVRRPLRYVFSFFGIVDLLSFLPTYITLLAPDMPTHTLVVLRSLRLLRVFRIFELRAFMRDADSLSAAVWEARGKIVVFLTTILIAVTIMGTAMYVVESPLPDSQFTSIPQSMYWAVVTMTTVGYGDIVPQTPHGKVLSAILILLGYSLIIVPTGFVSAEFVGRRSSPPPSPDNSVCGVCGTPDHQADASYCRRCGHPLGQERPQTDKS